MTWPEVVSDVVKIGLGAIVGGIFALVADRQAHSIRLREEYSRRRSDQLEQISVTFDEVTREASDHVAHLLSISAISDSKEEKEAILEASGHDILSDHEKLMRMLNQLHSIEARLALLALHHVSEEVEKFRHALTNIVLDGDAPEDEKKEGREEIADFLQTQRTVIVTLMALAYKNA